MDLNFQLLELRFSTGGELKHPTARFRVTLEDQRAVGSEAFFDITVPVPASTPAATLQEAHDAAHRIALTIVHRQAAAQWLAAVAADEAHPLGG